MPETPPPNNFSSHKTAQNVLVSQLLAQIEAARILIRSSSVGVSGNNSGVFCNNHRRTPQEVTRGSGVPGETNLYDELTISGLKALVSCISLS